MPLSLHKLEMMVSKYNMLMRKIYTIDNYCVYLELLCINTGDVCMLYIHYMLYIYIEHIIVYYFYIYAYALLHCYIILYSLVLFIYHVIGC